MADDEHTIRGGGYYGRLTPNSPLVSVPVDAVTREPDAWICRRVVDFPREQPPHGSAVAKCTRCNVLVAFNPRHVCAAPKVCMQCMKIQPLPMEEAL